MSKLIKLSDSVGYSLEKRAQEDNLSMAAEVAKLLATTELPPNPTDTAYFDNRFEELMAEVRKLVALVEDTRVSGGRATTPSTIIPEYVEWEQMQYIIFGLLEDNGAPEWIPNKGAIETLKEGYLDSCAFSIKDDVIYIDDTPMIKVTPRVRQAIDEKRVYG